MFPREGPLVHSLTGMFIIFVLGLVHDPSRSLPRGMIAGTAITTALYTLANVV